MFRIGAIRIQGTRARPETDVGAAAGLAAGEIYTQSAVAAARTRIESSYRRAGYTAARVTARSTPDDAAATVAVRFDFVEGPRQVVDTVVVDGGSRTNPGLVALALRVDPGNPVDPAAWNLARKRLYDTGVFRSVDIEARIPEAAGAARADGTVPVEARVTLEEWPRYFFRYGLRLTDEVAALGETTGRARIPDGSHAVRPADRDEPVRLAQTRRHRSAGHRLRHRCHHLHGRTAGAADRSTKSTKPCRTHARIPLTFQLTTRIRSRRPPYRPRASPARLSSR